MSRSTLVSSDQISRFYPFGEHTKSLTETVKGVFRRSDNGTDIFDKSRWDDATALMIDAAQRLERGGADFFLICTNTMHRMADQVQAAVRIPLLHIADPTAERIKAQGIRRVGLLGTAFTMEQEFYKGRLQSRFGLDVLVPEAEDRATVHRIIYDELVQGRVEAASREAYRKVIARLVDRGAEAVILGCTEIMLLVKPEDSRVPLFDTTGIHAEAAVERAIST